MTKLKKKINQKRKLNKIPLPVNIDDPIRLADWFEIKAIIDSSKSISKIELESVIKQSSIFDGKPTELIENLCLSVFSELENRVSFAGEGYPFLIVNNSLVQKNNIDQCGPYIFCLCLSYFENLPESKLRLARRLFEDLSCLTAKFYIGGNSCRFAHPRDFNSTFISQKYITKLSKGFKAAIKDACDLIGEGDGYSGEKIGKAKDKKLDVIAYKNFADNKTGKLILFGQCATGNIWRDLGKASELDPQTFWDCWIKKPKISQLIKAYFIPDIVENETWRELSINSKLLFERCRISEYASSKSINYCDYSKWYNKILGVK